VEQTAKECGLKYIYYPSVAKAFVSHIRLLKKLGRNDIKHLIQEMG
jgi:hypothetical protein